MNEMLEFQKSALQGVLTNPLCAEYKNEWRKCGNDKLKLVTLSLQQQAIPFVASHCYHNKGLTKDYIKREFADYINGYTVKDADGCSGYTYSLYCDYDYDNEIVADKDVVSVMYTKDKTIFVPQTKAVTMYISCCSDVSIVCEGYNSLILYVFDESKVTLEDLDEDTNVRIYRYSDESKVEIGRYCLSKNIHDFKKTLRL